jgi:hypothetical protein
VRGTGYRVLTLNPETCSAKIHGAKPNPKQKTLNPQPCRFSAARSKLRRREAGGQVGGLSVNLSAHSAQKTRLRGEIDNLSSEAMEGEKKYATLQQQPDCHSRLGSLSGTEAAGSGVCSGGVAKVSSPTAMGGLLKTMASAQIGRAQKGSCPEAAMGGLLETMASAQIGRAQKGSCPEAAMGGLLERMASAQIGRAKTSAQKGQAQVSRVTERGLLEVSQDSAFQGTGL